MSDESSKEIGVFSAESIRQAVDFILEQAESAEAEYLADLGVTKDQYRTWARVQRAMRRRLLRLDREQGIGPHTGDRPRCPWCHRRLGEEDE